MKFGKNKKTIAFMVLGLFALTGAYNAVVINAESHLSSEVKFVKRLDEINGVVVNGRSLATEPKWQKLAPVKMGSTTPPALAKVEATKPVDSEVPTFTDIPEPAVKENLSLSLVEVINPKKYATGVPAGQFTGSLATNNGVIESLNVTLPGSESVSVAFSEMTGNVFEYDYNGEIYAGMMYQVDQNAYMVTLTNGPLEGTRLRFSTETPAVEQQITQEKLAENNNVEVGNFGEAKLESDVEATSVEMANNDIATQGFKF